ncbi:hypothetical protein [Actinoplanes sp. N902-109]|uniref:hypothetical protein n=1 Tax=Actinoplanes sp. (strain N902-109) TaxID=649831 RepID=UPI0003295A6F|nr:hypothetical protein [Actinoplanes sp. N902-109]AGL17118.1 hypothetical protein L083_3608 [Actinoplanes sp. N902-109]
MAAARSSAQAAGAEAEAAQETAVRAAAAARGWQQRVEVTRVSLLAQHRREARAYADALAQVWSIVDRAGLASRDRRVDVLRAQHRDLLRLDEAGG